MKHKTISVIVSATVIAVVLLLATSPLASATEVKLAWTASPTPGVTNYVLRVTQGTHTARVNVGTNTTATISATNGVYSIFATAQKDGVESEPSNTLTFEVPAPPPTLRVIALEASAELNGTNWTTMGFFRLRIEP